MTSEPRIAVAMSVYINDRLSYLQESVQSILDQTYSNFHFFIEVDGKVNDEVYLYLKELNIMDNVSVGFNKNNKGLAYRLNTIIERVLDSENFKYIARMDADDISDLNRFEEQVGFLYDNPDVKILGTDLIEINNEGEFLFYKKMEKYNHDIISNIIKKCPLNHPTVMFDIEVFSEHCLRYRNELSNTQDYYLWIDAIFKGITLGNLDAPLLKFRIDPDFHKRRGLKKAFNELQSRIYAMRMLNVINIANVLHSISLFLLRISPEFVKRFAYKNLRK